jgi:serine/threonine protein phosphatase 1
MPTRTIAIGDIHGCSSALFALLDAIRPRPEDTIVTLGDYINRGPDSRGVPGRLIKLSDQCRLIPLLGNHDQMLLDVRIGKHPIFWLLDIGGTTTPDSYGPGRDLDLIPDDHFEFLEGCLDYFETDTHIFIHANYFPRSSEDMQRSCAEGGLPRTGVIRAQNLPRKLAAPGRMSQPLRAGESGLANRFSGHV